MRVASRVRNARSCVTNSTPPRNSSSASSSHWITSTSRWFVGSSSSSRSGSPTSARASATRRRQPPDSSATRASAASWCVASTFSTRSCSRQPSCASISCWSCSMRREQRRVAADLVRDVVVLGEQRAHLGQAAGDDVEHGGRRRRRAAPARAARCAAPAARQTSPSSGATLPSATRSSVDLPAPLRPIRQTRSPGLDLEARAVEQRLPAEGERDGVEAEQRHRGPGS